MKYYTIKKTQSLKIMEKGSKFIGNAFHVKNIDKIEELLNDIRKKHHSANHNCYSYRLGIKNNEKFRLNDDGEPSGSAGKPIYNEFLKHNISDILLIVTRYFGGKKLGIGGLIKAYGYCAENTLARCKKKAVIFGQKIHFPGQGYDLVKTATTATPERVLIFLVIRSFSKLGFSSISFCSIIVR